MNRSSRRWLTSFGIGLISGIASWLYQVSSDRAAGDLTWAIVAAQDLLAGHNPYLRELPAGMVTYPLPAALLAIPFVLLPHEFAAGLFMGISAFLLAWGLLRDGDYWRLLLFTSFPFWQAIQVVNWSPLLMAILFLPPLLPLVLAKPHVGLPVFLSRLSVRGIAACVVFSLLSLLIFPRWPIEWIMTIGGYAGNPMVLTLPFGFLLLLTLWNWKSDSSRYLLYCSIVPLRSFYDYILLWYLPKTYHQMALLTLCSWLSYFGWFFFSYISTSTWVFLGLYVPCLGIVVFPKFQQIHTTQHSSRLQG